MRLILRFAAVTATLLCACACGDDGREDPIPDPESRILYVSNPYADWAGGVTLSIDGIGNTPLSLDGNIAKLRVADSDIYHICYPEGPVFDKATGFYTATLPSRQEYSPAGADSATMLCCDYAMPGALSFMTASITNLSACLRISLTAKGTLRISTMELRSRGGEPVSGSVNLDCIAKTMDPVQDGTSASVTLDGKSTLISTAPGSPTVICIALIPGLFTEGFDCTLNTTDGKSVQISFPEEADIAPGQTLDLGDRTVEDPELTSIALTMNDFNSRNWSAAPSVRINGTESIPSSVSGKVLQVPVSPAASYTAVYPPELIEQEGNTLAVTVPGEQPYANTSAVTIPLLAGSSEGTELTLNPIYGALRINMYTVPGANRNIVKLRLTGHGISGRFTYNAQTGVYETERGTADTISVVPPEHLTEAVQGDFTKFRFTMVPGTYDDLKLEVTAYDASIPVPPDCTREDMYTVTTISLPTVTVPRADGIRADVGPQIIAYDWMQANGTHYIGGLPLASSSASIIDTGWLVPEGRGHAVEYECTMSGTVKSTYRNERIVFGGQGTTAVNRPVFFVYNQTSESGWFPAMANVDGLKTRQQETGGKVYHIDKALSDRRTVIIGCAGVFGTSYIYAKWRNEKLGQTQWTSLTDQSEYFRFSDGNLRAAYTVFLFALNNGGNVKSPTNEVRIHRFIVRYDGASVIDMTPCSVDGIPAMYDSIGKKYYFNATPSVIVDTRAGCMAPFLLGYNSEIDD